jgi:aspartate carbamoyltransferase catalytic subunit
MSRFALLNAPVSSGSADTGVFRTHEARESDGHLLGLEGLGRVAIESLLDRAEHFRARIHARRVGDELRGVAVCLAFFEDSTRTRVSFELAAQRLGAMPVALFPQGSSMSKGESLLDTLETIVSMGVDVVVVRHRSAGAPAYLARHLDAAVVNAGDGAHEHPTQGVLDLLTLKTAWRGRFEGRRLAIVGDLAHSRVARSAVHGLRALGAAVTVAGPATLMPAGIETLGCTVAATVEDAMRGADAVMALRIQCERMEQSLIPSAREYARAWGVTAERVSLMKPEAVVMHPGPFNRGVEIASDVVDGPRSVIREQVANGVAVRCAVLERCVAARRANPRHGLAAVGMAG